MVRHVIDPRQKPRIMFVDDDVASLDAMSQGLESFGFEVNAFSNPSKALSHFKLLYYDTVILDVRMPEISGFELARRIWQQDQNQTICFFSAFEEYENEALNRFVHKNYCFIKKPIHLAELIKHIDNHISAKM
jgi:DNA-binding response OmpR family regulator